jgi:hypothetical protein
MQWLLWGGWHERDKLSQRALQGASQLLQRGGCLWAELLLLLLPLWGRRGWQWHEWLLRRGVLLLLTLLRWL